MLFGREVLFLTSFSITIQVLKAEEERIAGLSAAAKRVSVIDMPDEAAALQAKTDRVVAKFADLKVSHIRSHIRSHTAHTCS